VDIYYRIIFDQLYEDYDHFIISSHNLPSPHDKNNDQPSSLSHNLPPSPPLHPSLISPQSILSTLFIIFENIINHPDNPTFR